MSECENCYGFFKETNECPNCGKELCDECLREHECDYQASYNDENF